MTAIATNRNTKQLAGLGQLPTFLTVKDAAILFAGIMLAIDATPEALEASDTAALQVIGRCPEYIDNTDDGELVNPEMGCFKYENDGDNPVVATDKIAYVHDNQTVCASAGSTHKVVAGLVIAVESDGVWMCQTLEGIKAAQALHDAGSASASATIAALTGTLTGTVNGALVDVAAAAGACAGSTTPSASNVDTAIATAVATIVTGVNEQNKELMTTLNAVIAALKAQNIILSA